jgi:hypothetical protein
VTSSPTSSPTPGTAQDVDPVLYPNPVKDSNPLNISIGFAQNNSWAQIKIYTTVDRRVKNVTYSLLPAGMNNIQVELKDDWGTPLANGLYYVLVTTPDQKFIKKLLILK